MLEYESQAYKCFRLVHCFRVNRVAKLYFFFKYINVFKLTSTDAFWMCRVVIIGVQLIEFIYDHRRTIR